MTGRTGHGTTGFSLLELMVALAIVALLALVALPAYSRYLQQGRLSEAAALLTAHAATLERRFLETRRYDDDSGQCTLPGGRFFVVDCQLTATGYELIARNRAARGLGPAGNFEYRLDSSGQRHTTRFAGRAVELPCWQLRPEGGCP